MLQVTKRYMGSQTRKLLPDTPSFAGLYGDMDSARLNIEFPEVYNTYTKYVRFNVTLTDAEGNSYIPVYAMTDNSLIIPQEISNIYATEGNEDSVITFSVLLYYGDSLIETSLPGTIYFATTDDIVSTSTPHYTNILLRLAQEAFIQAEFSIDSIADRPIVTFSTISGTDTPITLEVPYLASGKIPTQFLPGSAVVDLFHITDPSELTTLTNAHTPDMAIVTAGAYTGNIYILTSDTPTTASDWAPMYSAVDATKLATIATGAQVNVIESISANGVALEITDKNVDITIPENLSDLNSDATHRTVSDTQISGWDAKQNALTFDNVPTADSSNPVKSGGVYSSLATKQDTLTFDSTPISGSSNPVTSGGVYTSVSGKVDKVSGKELSSNDFTDALETKLNGIDEGAQVNAIFTMPTPSADYLGKDYHFVGETAGGFVQNTFYTCISNGTDYLWSPSNPAVAGVAWGNISGILSSQKDLQTALDAKQNTLTFDDAPTSGSSNPVTSAGIYTSVSAKQDTMSAGTGISFSGTTINHSNTISAGTVGSDTNVPVITYDAQGHISGVSSATIYPPATAGTSGQIWQSRGSGIGIWQSLDATPISGSTVAITSGAVYSALATKQNTLSFDNTPIASSTNPVTSGGVYSALDTKQDTLTAGSNITIESNVISAQIVVPPAGISDTFYMDSATTLSDTPPISEVYADIVMSGTTGTSITLTYTLPEDRIISPTATYQFASNLRNITTGTVYTITATATYGTTIIATGTQSVTATDTSEYNVIAMSNQLSSNLNVVATGTVVLTFTMSKDSASAQTAQLFSSPAGYTSFTRNGGNISANNVYDKVAGNNYTQASINSQFYSDIASKVTANGAITANTASYVFPSYDTKGLTTGAIKTVYQKSIYLNGTSIGFITDQYNSDITIYSPTTAGTSGQYLISTGGVPSWATLDLSGYQLKNNLVTAFQTTPDNSHYPSELLVYTQLNTKQNTLTFDSTPTTGSANPVTSGGVYSALSVKQNTITGGASTITTSNLTVNRALLSNSSGKVAVSAVTSTELGYMSGVTSAIQTQINGKQDALTFDSTPTVDSAKPVTSDGIYRALTLKQDTMSAGTGISLSGTTINHETSITAGSVGSALSVPIITYNTTGHITAISSATIYPPTTAGTAGQYWVSDGAGAGAWQSLATSAISDSGVSITSGAVYTALAGKQNTLTFDSAPTSASSNPVTSGGVYAALAGKQATLSFDATPTLDSTNPVTSGGVYSSLSGKQDNISAGTGLTLSGATVNHASSITAGSVGSATLVPVITFNGTGHITATSTATIYPPTSAGTSGQYWRSDGSGQGVWQSMITAPTSGSAYAITAGAVYTALSDKQDTLTFDNTPTSASTNPVTSGGVYTALSGKQATLTFDSAPTSGSANPVTSDGIYTAINTKATTVTYTGTVSTTWTGSSAPYSQMITINGILATDNPIIDVVLSSTWATAILQSEAWTKIQRIVTSANTLTVYATEATTTAIPIQIKVVR